MHSIRWVCHASGSAKLSPVPTSYGAFSSGLRALYSSPSLALSAPKARSGCAAAGGQEGEALERASDHNTLTRQHDCTCCMPPSAKGMQTHLRHAAGQPAWHPLLLSPLTSARLLLTKAM